MNENETATVEADSQGNLAIIRIGSSQIYGSREEAISLYDQLPAVIAQMPVKF